MSTLNILLSQNTNQNNDYIRIYSSNSWMMFDSLSIQFTFIPVYLIYYYLTLSSWMTTDLSLPTVT